MNIRQPLDRRLLKRRLIIPETNCWVWLGHIQTNGYGKIYYEGNYTQVHRVAAKVWLNFDMDSKVPICHINSCHRRDCFNPDHLYIGSQSRNLNDAVELGTQANSRKTHCPKGHPYDEENTIINITKFGKFNRHCRSCESMRIR